jgi:2'-5' RNA ligase
VRLFVALRPPPDAMRHAASAVEAVRVVHEGPRWVPAERWHLTLAFYGEVAGRDVDRTARRVGRAVAGAGAMDLALAGAGSFARRALWLGVTGRTIDSTDGSDDVTRLEALARALSSEPRPRPYRPHLTIARLRADTDPAAAEAAVAALSAYAGPSWRATEVHLVHSQLRGGQGPTYDDLATWTLPPVTSEDRS